jgi:hypothetical protein
LERLNGKGFKGYFYRPMPILGVGKFLSTFFVSHFSITS